jgi:hypothetical protein
MSGLSRRVGHGWYVVGQRAGCSCGVRGCLTRVVMRVVMRAEAIGLGFWEGTQVAHSGSHSDSVRVQGPGARR